MTEQTAPNPPGGTRLTLGLLSLLALMVVASLAIRYFIPGGSAGESHPSVGKLMPEMVWEPLVNTTEQASLDTLKGRAVLINFWGPWCPPCKAEMPHLIELQKRLADRDDFVFVSVSTGVGQAYADVEELRDETDDYARRMAIEFPIHADLSGASRTTLIETATLSGFGYPTSVLLDREHVIRALWLGYNDGMEDEMNAVVLGVLSR